MRTNTPAASHAAAGATSGSLLSRCVAQCFDCAEACTGCAHACMEDASKNHLQECVRLNLDCADLCFAAGTLAAQSAQTDVGPLMIALTRAADACQACAEESQRRADWIDNCVASAEACRSCHEALMLAIQDVGGDSGVIQTN